MKVSLKKITRLLIIKIKWKRKVKINIIVGKRYKI